MNFILEIELLSPASPGSGEGWAGMIDSDVVFDEYGLPYIPARRIKGILREMAYDLVETLEQQGQPLLQIDAHAVRRLFGVRGAVDSAPLAVQNAYLADYAAIRAWLEWANGVVPQVISPASVLATLSHMRQQTRIEANGTAAEGSLRSTRVLNRHLKFFCEIEIEHDHERFAPLLALAARMMRSLGEKRNRGLGRVSCRLLDRQQRDSSEAAMAELAQKMER